MKVGIKLDRGSSVTVTVRSIKSVGVCSNGRRVHRKMADGGVIQIGVY